MQLSFIPTQYDPSPSDEWYTPPKYIELARKIMGSIDVDPASNAVAQSVVQATNFYTLETNGLTKSWHGNVWLNPPYSAQIIMQFVDKAFAELHAGHLKQIMILTENSTETFWCQKLLAVANCCFLNKRVCFWNPAKLDKPTQPRRGHILFYIGDNKVKFSEVIGGQGVIFLK